MQIAEMFINLGVKGSEKSISAVQATDKALTQLKDTSLAVKAAMVGAFYALYHLFEKSGDLGTGLVNFNALTGESVRTLQQFQNAGRQVGLTAEEMTDSLKKFQMTYGQALFEGKMPPTLAMFAARLRDLTGEATSLQEMQKWMSHPELLIQKASRYARSGESAFLLRDVLGQMGFSDQFIAGLKRGGFEPGALRRAGQMEILSPDQAAALDRAQVTWANTWHSIMFQFDLFNAKYGPQLAKDVEKIVSALIRLGEAIEKSHFLDVVVKLIDRLSTMISGGIVGSAQLTRGVIDEYHQQANKAYLKKFYMDDPIIGPMLRFFQRPAGTQHVVIHQQLPAGAKPEDHAKATEKAMRKVHANTGTQNPNLLSSPGG